MRDGELLNLITDHFDLGELRTLCFELSVEHDTLEATERNSMARELIRRMRREQRLDELLTILKQKRPSVDWPDKLETGVHLSTTRQSEPSVESPDDIETSVYPPATKQPDQRQRVLTVAILIIFPIIIIMTYALYQRASSPERGEPATFIPLDNQEMITPSAENDVSLRAGQVSPDTPTPPATPGIMIEETAVAQAEETAGSVAIALTQAARDMTAEATMPSPTVALVTATATPSPTTTPTPSQTPTPLATPSGGASSIVYVSDQNNTLDIFRGSLPDSNISSGLSSFQPLVSNPTLIETFPHCSPDGTEIVYVHTNNSRDYSLFSKDITAPTSSPVFLTHTFDLKDNRWPAWSHDGSQIVFSARNNTFEYFDLYIMDLNANRSVRRITSSDRHDLHPSWSPDGAWIVFASGNNTTNIWKIHVETGEELALTDDEESVNGRPVWSPNGELIAFQSKRNDTEEVFVMRVDGSELVQLTDLQSRSSSPAWSPDSRWIAFESDAAGPFDIYLVAIDPPGIPIRMTRSDSNERFPSWCPQLLEEP